jgi:hypothetical protein
MTSTVQGEELALTNFTKIVSVEGKPEALAVAGNARIGASGRDVWIGSWLQQFVNDVADSFVPNKLADQLVDSLNEESLPYDQSHIVLIAAWVTMPDTGREVPVVMKVSRDAGEGPYTYKPLLDQGFVSSIDKWRTGDKDSGYPVLYTSAGIPSDYHSWIAETGSLAHSKQAGGQVPQPNIASVAEYVRFLIRSVAELHKIARRPAYVGVPVETLLLLPDPTRKIAVRY